MKKRTTAATRPILTAAQRKADYRARLEAGGRKTINAAVTAATAEKLKAMAYDGRSSLGATVDACVGAAEAAQRKARWRAKMAADGKKVLTVAVGIEVARLAQALALENKRSVTDVLELGLKVAQRELNAIAARKAAECQAAKAK